MPDAAAIAEQIYKLAARDEAQLYAVLDACRCRVAEMVATHGVEHEILWNQPGDVPDALRGALPYLTVCRPRRPFASWVFNEGWGDSWGIFAVSRAGIGEVAHAMRQNLSAETPDGETMFFRFYDPRVLRVFIPTCTPEQITELYGPVLCFAMESENAEILSFRRGQTEAPPPSSAGGAGLGGGLDSAPTTVDAIGGPR